jgi:hypothetical protein
VISHKLYELIDSLCHRTSSAVLFRIILDSQELDAIL